MWSLQPERQRLKEGPVLLTCRPEWCRLMSPYLPPMWNDLDKHVRALLKERQPCDVSGGKNKGVGAGPSHFRTALHQLFVGGSGDKMEFS